MRALFCVAYPRVKFVYFWSMHSAIISLLPPPGVAWCMLSHLPPASTRCGMVYVVTPPSCLHQVWHGVCCHTSLLPPPGVAWCMLSHLPPASTRCGMVYVDPNELKWSPYVRTWLQKLPEGMKEETKKYLWGLFASYLDEGFKFVRKNCTQGIDQVCTLATAPALQYMLYT